MRLAGIVLGLGLGGFVDGITLHQIMQWHNMGSAVLPPTTMDAMAQNMVWDGLFHAATLVFVARLTISSSLNSVDQEKNDELQHAPERDVA